MRALMLFLQYSAYLIFGGCFSTKAPTNSNKTQCCESLNHTISKGHPIEIPFRRVDKNLMGVPLIADKRFKVNPDSFYVFTESEYQRINNLLFCFFGREEAEIDSIFKNFESDKLSLNKNGTFIKVYHCSIGNYYIDNNVTDDDTQKNLDRTEFWLTNFSHFDFFFSREGKKTIFTGSYRDSINLTKCQNQDK